MKRFVYKKRCCCNLPEKSLSSFFFQKYYIETSMPNRIFYVSPEDQTSIQLEFVQRLPWNSFGRKNFGYLFAIARGARVIFDFDDDNILKFWINSASPDPWLDIDHIVDNINTLGSGLLCPVETLEF